MQFPVPQFIDIEDKLIGPFSLKQFGFIFVGGLIVVGLFRVLGLNFIFIILALPIALASLVLTFGKFNGRPIYESFPIFFGFFSSPKNLVFQKKGELGDLRIQPITVAQIKAEQTSSAKAAEIPEEPQSKLKRLSRLLQQKTAEEQEIIKEVKNMPKPPAGELKI